MKNKFYYGLMAAAGLLFAGCSSEDIPVGPNEIPTDGERTLYVNINIRGDVDGNGSRVAADDDNPASGVDFAGGESDVQTVYFVFYDKDGNPVGDGALPVDIKAPGFQTVTDVAENGTVDKYYKSVVGVTITGNQQTPTQIICYLNPRDPGQLCKPLNEMQEEERPNFYNEVDGKKYFSMSNSVFYTSTAADAPQIAVQIAPNQIFNTRKAAEAALDDKGLTVNIYVERYGAKLTFKSVKPDVYKTFSRLINGGDDVAVDLTFVPNTWMLNSQCQTSYIVKSFRKENPNGSNPLDDNYSYSELNSIINRAVDGTATDWNWNSTNRSYWAMSPAYFTAEYPEVSSDVESMLENGKDLYQHYYSYDELINGIDGEEPVGFALPTTPDGVTEYVHESTVGTKGLNSRNTIAALASVIYVGDYTLKIGASNYTEITFYTYGVVDANVEDPKPLVYFEAKEESTVGASVIDGTESMLRGFLVAATNLYKKVGDEYKNFDLTNTEEVEKLVAVLEVAEPSDDVKGNLKIPERYRTLQFRKGVTEGQLEGIYVGASDGYYQVTTGQTPGIGQIAVLTANQELMKVVGYCATYTEGAAYFNIPVKHLGWYRKNNPNNVAGATMDWSKVRVGDFGVVRNHSYTVEVSAITGLGTGIGGKDNPIVPPAEENKYYIAYSVNILKWAVVPTQNVKL